MGHLHYIVPVCVSWIVTVFLSYWWFSPSLKFPWSYETLNKTRCIYSFKDKEGKCRPVCGNGSFSLYGMSQCYPWLSCDEIPRDLHKGRQIGQGAVKLVFLAKWKDYEVVWSEPITPAYLEDYRHGIEILKTLSDKDKLVQVIGICGDIVITEFHRYGSAANVNSFFSKEEQYDTIKNRFNLCVDYAEMLSWLHNQQQKYSYVMCDSNDLNKTLQQYLITEDLHLVLNDVDSLARLDHTQNELIKCGHRELGGDFVAPEQLWPFEDDFDDDKMPGYDEKTDVWKIPAVCCHFLQFGRAATDLRLKLFDIHSRCKNNNPVLRPSASDVLVIYRKMLQQIS